MNNAMKSQKKQVLIYSPSFGIWGGGQIYIEQLCNYLNMNGVSAYILTAEPDAFSCPTKMMENVLSKKKRLLSSIKIAKRYKKEGFDTIILNDLSSLWLAPIFKLFGYKTISLLHMMLQHKKDNQLAHSNLEYYALKTSSYFCDKILSVNKNNQDVLGFNRVQFIGNYVPNWFFDKVDKHNDKDYDFIMVSRLSVEKNIPLFLKLLKNLNDRSKRVYNALIVGDGSEKEHLYKIVNEHQLEKNVDFQNWVERKDLPSVYDRGKYFVISSHHEGFATTLLEAHARGIPAIVTKSSGFCGEFVNGYNNVTGLVFEPKDLNDFAFYQNITTLIDEYRSYDEKCRTKAKIFSEKNVLGPILKAVKGE